MPGIFARLSSFGKFTCPDPDPAGQSHSFCQPCQQKTTVQVVYEAWIERWAANRREGQASSVFDRVSWYCTRICIFAGQDGLVFPRVQLDPHIRGGDICDSCLIA